MDVFIPLTRVSLDWDTLHAMQAAAERRVCKTLAHVSPVPCGGATCKKDPYRSCDVDIVALRRLWDGSQFQMKNAIREFITAEPLFRFVYDVKSAEMRELTLRWVKSVTASGIVRLRDIVDDPERFFAAFETLAFFDTNVIVKMAVQYSLWGGNIVKLGTERHHHMIPAIENMQLPGIFAMTELGHGSNVRGIETTATYDPTSKEFVLDTPTKTSAKYWLGNAACHGVIAAVYARLIIGGQDKGVHVFVVPLRCPETMKPLPGVTPFDCGPKMGLNGVDNGGFFLKSVRIPRENLLNRFSDVTAEGQYVCKLPSEGRHFGAVVGSLTSGRVIIGGAAVSISKVGVAIGIGFGSERKQFAPSGSGPESAILEYPTHQIRLMPLLAKTAALDILLKHASHKFSVVTTPAETAELHALSAGFKAIASWHVINTLQTVRECCGGQGYRAMNRIANLKADTDIFATFEGDNTVLMQQVTRFLLSVYQRMSKEGRFSGPLAYMEGTGPRFPSLQNPSLLRDSAFYASAFAFREGALLKELAKRLMLHAKTRMTPGDAFNKELVLVVRLAHAHMDRVLHMVFEATMKRREVLSNPNVERPLRKLLSLTSLSALRSDLGFFAAYGVFSSDLCKGIEDEVVALCKEVTSFALSVVDSFGIPAKCLPPHPNLLTH